MQVDFNQSDGSFSFCDPLGTNVILQSAAASIRFTTAGGKSKKISCTQAGGMLEESEFTDVHGRGRQVTLHASPGSDGIALTCCINTYHNQPFSLLQLTVTNLSILPIYLDEFCLFHAHPSSGGKLHMPGPAGEIRFFKAGWVGWSFSGALSRQDRNSRRISDLIGGKSYINPVTPRVYKKGEFWSEGWGILAGRQSAVLAGLVSMKHQFGQVHACLAAGEQALSLVTQADGIRLDPGESCSSEWGYIQFIPLPHPEPSEDYVRAVVRQMGARVPAPPPLTWTHWYQYYHDVNEELFIENLGAIAARQDIYPCRVVELDDGYQAAWGDWTMTNSRFPRGLGDLAARVRERGFTPGLWLAPFTVEPDSMLHRQHPEWLLKDGHGRPVNAGFVYNIFLHALDTSHPAVLEHLHQVIETITSKWGFGMLKLDFLNTVAMAGKRFNPKLTRADCLRIGLETIRQAAGEETFLLGCGCPFGPAIGIVDAMRVGSDTAPSWEPYFNWLPWAGKLIRNEPSPPSLRNALRNTLNLSPLHQRWWWNDPDCLIVRESNTRLTLAEVQTAVTVVGLSGGMLVLSDDMRGISPERLHWVSLLVPNLGLRGLPVDWMEPGMPRIYRVRLTLGEAEWQMVGLFNWEHKPRTLALHLEDLGFPAGAEVHVFDFWKGTHWRTVEASLTFENIPPHGCRLLRLCQVGEGPQVVGDTLHISGGAEFVRSSVEDSVWTLETLDLGRRVDGELWLSLPEKPGEVTCNGEVVQVEEKGKGVYRLRISFDGVGRIEVGLG